MSSTGAQGKQGVTEAPEATWEKTIAEKIMKILREEKLTRDQAKCIMFQVDNAIDREATLGYSSVRKE
jgi:hypothetical protein